MAEGKSKWVLDLDIKEFTQGVLQAKGQLSQIGDAKNLAGLTEGLLKASRLLGIVGAAALAVKGSFELVFAAEEIKSINNQFDVLAKNAGIAGDTIKDKLVGASGGLVDDEEVIKSASEQIIKLGTNASKLPDIMELARKHTNAFGGDMIQKFDQISSAIANGQVRQLKSLGIIIDQEKAYKEYAKAIGKTVDTLSQEEKQRALLNATLKKGGDALKGVTGDSKEATQGWEKLKVTLGNLKDEFVLAFDRVMGPTVKRMISNMNVLAEVTTEWFKDNFGAPADQAKAKLQGMNEKINELNFKIMEAKNVNRDGSWWDKAWAGGPKEIERNIKYLERLRKERDDFQATMPKDAAKPDGGGEGDTPEGDDAKVLEQKNKFHSDLLKMKRQRLDAELAMSSTSIDEQGNVVYQGELIQQEKIKLLHEQTLAQIQEIKDSDKMTEAQKGAMILETQKAEHAERIRMEDELKGIREANMNKYVADSTTAGQGVTRAFQQGALENKKALTDWGATGKMVFGSFKKESTSALLAFGAGTKTAGEAIKGMMFGVVADTAEAKGQEMLLAGIWPPNPPAIAGGAGLIALAGFLRSKAGGSSSGGMGGAGGGGGGSATSAVAQESPEVKAMPKKAVSINVQGSYFETEQTQRRLVELIRQESDATDFSFRQIGG